MYALPCCGLSGLINANSAATPCRLCVVHRGSDVGVHHAERSLVTVWSAPNYCYRCGNVASILCFDENLEREVKYFTETEENSTTMAPRSNVSYFL